MTEQSGAVKGGWTKVPNSVVENLYVLTPAETAMVLIILRRRDDKDAKKHGGCLISDANWEKWTRLAERQKLNAIKGLAAKGLLIDGQEIDPDSKLPYRGDKARFSFDDSKFRAYVRTFVDPEGRARTAGRPKAVSAPAGFLVHDDCKKNGCQNLCTPKEQKACIVPLPVAPAVPAASVQASAPIPAPAPQRRKPAVPETLVKTETILGQMYPTAGRPFLELLAQTCAKQTKQSFTDDDLAAALDLAWRAKRGAQKSEGLFLKTVPPILGRVLESRLAFESRQSEESASFEALPDTGQKSLSWSKVLWDFSVTDTAGRVHRADFQDIAARLEEYRPDMPFEQMERLFVSVEVEAVERGVKFVRAVDPEGWAADLKAAASSSRNLSGAALERVAFLARFGLPSFGY